MPLERVVGCAALTTSGEGPRRGTEPCFVGAAEICSFPEPRTFARTVCLVRHLDTIPPELHEQFLDGVLERVGAAGSDPLVLGYVRLTMVACLPDAPLGDPPGRLPALARLVHGWFTTVAPG